jgi:hypothetical protein
VSAARAAVQARAGRRLSAAEADRVAVGVGEHADSRLRCHLPGGDALGRASGEEGCPGCVEILDVGVGHGSVGRLAWSEADLEAVDVVSDVLGLIGVRRAEQRGVDGFCDAQIGHRDHQAADRRTHVRLLSGERAASATHCLSRGNGSTERIVTAMDNPCRDLRGEGTHPPRWAAWPADTWGHVPVHAAGGQDRARVDGVPAERVECDHGLERVGDGGGVVDPRQCLRAEVFDHVTCARHERLGPAKNLGRPRQLCRHRR